MNTPDDNFYTLDFSFVPSGYTPGIHGGGISLTFHQEEDLCNRQVLETEHWATNVREQYDLDRDAAWQLRTRRSALRDKRIHDLMAHEDMSRNDAVNIAFEEFRDAKNIKSLEMAHGRV